FLFSSRRRHTMFSRDWSSDVCSSDLAAVALENLDIFDEEGLNANVRENSPLFRAELEKLLDLPMVGDVRGDGYFFGIELVKDKRSEERRVGKACELMSSHTVIGELYV